MNRSEIPILLFKYKLNTVTEEERLLIEKLIAEDSAVNESWERLKNEDFPDDIIVHARTGGSNHLQEVRNIISRRKIWRRMLYSAIAASFLAGIIAWEFNISNRTEVRNSDLLSQSRVELILDNGNRVSLDSTVRVVKSGNSLWTNNMGRLNVRSEKVANISWSTLKVPAKQDYSIQLPDGSTVQLNSVTQLKFPSAFYKTREVFLEGEAFFTVAENATMPFVVHTKNGSVRVLGTSFNVNAYSADEQITSLVVGKVAIETGGKLVTLHPGQAGISKKDVGIQVSSFDLSSLNWRTGIYTMDNLELSEVSRIINRWYNVQVIFDDPELSHLTLSGKIHKNKPLSVLIDNISAVLEVSFYFKNSELHLKR